MCILLFSLFYYSLLVNQKLHLPTKIRMSRGCSLAFYLFVSFTTLNLKMETIPSVDLPFPKLCCSMEVARVMTGSRKEESAWANKTNSKMRSVQDSQVLILKTPWFAAIYRIWWGKERRIEIKPIL